MESIVNCDSVLLLKATELRLGLPGRDEPEKQPSSSTRSNKRASSEIDSGISADHEYCSPLPPNKAQVVGWPPVRSYRKKWSPTKKADVEGGVSRTYVKVSMDGVPYLRKIDLKVYKSYPEFLKALENMFKCTFGEYSEREGYSGSDFSLTYEDKDDDWMLVGDVPWGMLICYLLQEIENSKRI